MYFRMMLVYGLFFFSCLTTAQPFYLDRVDKTPCRKTPQFADDFDMHRYFSLAKPAFEQEAIITNPLALQQAARDALAFLKRYGDTHKPIVAPQPFSTQILSTQKVIETLSAIDEFIEEDKKTGVYRIQKTDFLKDKFGFVAWKPDREAAHRVGHTDVTETKIKLTNYVIYWASGSYEKSETHPCALYQLVHEKKRVTLTKQEILRGAFEKNEAYKKLVEPLVWVSKKTLDEAMLQGTVLLVMPDGKKRSFTVNISNGHKFNRQIKQLAKQKIYWFFLERKNEQSFKKFLDRSTNRKGVIFAGDLYSIGLGKIVAIQYYNRKTKRHELQLGVLGDTGSAFDHNLYHLDLYGGIVANKAEVSSYVRNFPPAVTAFIVYKK